MTCRFSWNPFWGARAKYFLNTAEDRAFIRNFKSLFVVQALSLFLQACKHSVYSQCSQQRGIYSVFGTRHTYQ